MVGPEGKSRRNQYPVKAFAESGEGLESGLFGAGRGQRQRPADVLHGGIFFPPGVEVTHDDHGPPATTNGLDQFICLLPAYRLAGKVQVNRYDVDISAGTARPADRRDREALGYR